MFICLSLLFAFTLFLSVFSSKLRNAASLGIGLTFCMGFLIIGNKEYLGGETLPDLQMYKEFFLQKENIDNIELSWSFLKNIVKAFGGTFAVFLMIYGFIYLYTNYKAIWACSSNVYLSLVFFYSYFFLLHGVIQMRAGVASGFFFLSIIPLYNKKLISFILLSACACFFHVSSLLVLPLYFFNPYRINLPLYLCISLFGIFLVFFDWMNIISLISFIPDNMVQTKVLGYFLYSDTDVFYLKDCLGVLLRIPIIILLLLHLDILRRKNKYVILLLKIYIYGLLLFFLMVNTVPIVAGRMFEFFQIVEVVLFPLLIYCFPQKKIGYMCMLAFAITIFFFKTFKLLQ